MPSTVVSSDGWGMHAMQCMRPGIDSLALLGLDGRWWGGASVAGIAPVHGVHTIPRWSTLLADLQAGRMSTALVLETITYMTIRCEAGASIHGKRGTACAGVGLSPKKKVVIAVLADTSRGGSSASLALALDGARSYFDGIGF